MQAQTQTQWLRRKSTESSWGTARTDSDPPWLLDGTCSICIQGIPTESPDVGMSAGGLPCGHRFHVRCISRWLDHHASCPTCRKPVAAVTRLVLSSALEPLPASTGKNASEASEASEASASTVEPPVRRTEHRRRPEQRHRGGHRPPPPAPTAQQQQQQQLYDAIGWAVVTAAWVAILACFFSGLR